MLPVSRQHNYYSFMSRSTCISFVSSNKLATISLPIYKQHVDGNRTHVVGNMLPVKAALDVKGQDHKVMQLFRSKALYGDNG